MPYPMPLHSHFLQVRNGKGNGSLGDAVIVRPHMGRRTFD